VDSGDLTTAGARIDSLLQVDPGSMDDERIARLIRLWSLTGVLSGLPEDEPFPELPTEPPWWTRRDLDRPEVQEARDRFLSDGGRGLRIWVGRASPYLEDLVASLDSTGLPPELWVLPVVESGFRHNARSRSNAVGPWQFVANTARYCGLLITLDRDERQDWDAATLAAGKYLRELKKRFGDGLLALAAFNCGPSRVSREIADRDSVTFWDLKLPPETRRYVPRVLALVELLGAGSASEYPPDPEATLRYDELELPYPVRVRDLARACGVETGDLLQINPSWLRPVTPGDGHPVLARVPEGAVPAVQEELATGELPEVELSPERTHQVERGDTLWDISRRYSVSLDALLMVNGMSGKETIHPGRVLRLPG
jgi:membrane-bound lytic murein transglycosylase D